jgi:UDP-glucose 4-epimerase
MRVAVTGGAGFIGQAVVKELEDRDHAPIVLDAKDGFDIVNAPLDRLRDADAVIHLAGMLGTEELFGRTEQAIDVNVKGASRVLAACAEYGVRFVGISMPEVWDNVYQVTKRAATGLAHAWHKHYGVPVSHVRAYNVFGPYQKIVGVRKIVPTFSVLGWQQQPLTIWGDGSQTVDLIHVRDVARMMVDALAFGDCEVFDAGTGYSQSVNDVAHMTLAATGSTAGLAYGPMRKGEHPTNIVAGGEGWDKLGWKPEFRHDDLIDTINWYKQFA